MNSNKLRQSLVLTLFILSGVIGFNFVNFEEFNIIKLKNFNLFSDILKDSKSDNSKKNLKKSSFKVKKQNKTTLSKNDFLIVTTKDSCPPNITCIEDFSDSLNALDDFFEALLKIKTQNKKVRIAFYGDSFVDGDILTSSLRNKLQHRFGGSGVGFVPITSEIAGFRKTIFHKFVNFNSFNIVKSSKLKLPFASGGQLYRPYENNMLSYAGIPNSTKLNQFKNVRIIYQSSDTLNFTYYYNKEYKKSKLIPSPKLSVNELTKLNTKSISFVFDPEPELNLYGVSFEDTIGITLDNFALKSHSGLNLSLISYSKHKEFDSLQNYNLLILEYGLNVVNSETKNLSWYIHSMTKIINTLKATHPNTSILILGISDRSVRNDGELKTMSSIYTMIDAQKQIAKNCKVAFWDMFEAMGGENSMIEFVQHSPPLANKDYTHITFKGGEKISELLYKSLLTKYETYKKKHSINYTYSSN